MKRTFFLTIIMLLCSWAYAETILVDVNGTGDFTSISEAIAQASDGDEIVVLDGIYTGESNREMGWDGAVKHLIVRSQNGPENCIIDCEDQGRAFYFNYSNQTRDDVIEGFTIENGNAGRHGGGIFCTAGSIIVRNCIIRHCIAGTGNAARGCGGAIFFNDGADGIIENCLLEYNVADATDFAGGGAIGLHHTQNTPGDYPIVRNNIIRYNEAWHDYMGGGGGITIYYSDALVENNLFYGNTTDDHGGGVYCLCSNAPVIRNNIIVNNSSTHYAPTGGGIGVVYSNPIIYNNIVASNDDYGIYSTTNALQINNNDVWNNTAGNYYGCSAGTGCISEDPMFVAPTDFVFTLSSDSPCIDAGSDENIGYPFCELDLLGNPRFVDGNLDSVVGIDMGCYEFQPEEDDVVVDIYAGQVFADAGSTATVPITCVIPDELNIQAFEIVVNGFGTEATPVDVMFTDSMPDANNWITEWNLEGDDLYIACAGSTPINGEGLLANIVFDIPSTPELNVVDVTFGPVTVNTGIVPVVSHPGRILVGLEDMFGDVDMNGDVQAWDASLILQYLTGQVDFDEIQMVIADASFDGEITSLDATLILKYVVGAITELPYEVLDGEFDASAEILGEDVTISGSSYIEVPFTLANVDNVYACSWTFTYDASLLAFESIEYPGMSFNSIEYSGDNGIVHVSCSSSSPINVEEATIVLNFSSSVSGLSDTYTNVYFQSAKWNEMELVEDPAVTEVYIDYLGSDDPSAPGYTTALNACYPNPFNPETTVSFSLENAGHACVEIYNTRGQKITTLVDENLTSGAHSYIWDGTDARRKPVASGLYLIRMTSAGKSFTRKAMLMK